ncbi:MAG TPA: hypothetical protein DCM40_32810 [Maribacter sp.]|nr:hypothetical protein [Maribacter sp.]
MKLTKQTLKRIIKEELNHLMLEQQTEEAAIEAEELLSDPKASKVIDDLSKKPEVAAAVQDIIAQLQSQQMSEGYYAGEDDRETMGMYLRSKGAHPDQQSDRQARHDDDTGELMAGGAFFGAMASPLVASMVMNSAAGAALVSALSPYMDGALVQLGVGAAAMGASVVIPMAIAAVLSGGDKSKG